MNSGGDGPHPAGDWTDRPAEDVASGAILGGKYRLISELGRGGMGSVWRAEHLGWDAPVALKLMNSDITAHPEARVRFEREVRLAAGLRSPHVVQVLDHGVDEDTGTPFIAMELLEGEPLARRVRRSRLSPAETFDVISQLARALSRAHAAGIVHRDLKPDNVFLVKNEEESLVKVLDFGVAKWTAPDILESGLTRPGSVVGTPYYMSPEQIQGSREIDHRVDLWALAAIACECLTGRRPFEAPDFAQLAVLLLGQSPRPVPSRLGAVPAGFDAWFARATDADILRRFQSARELVQALAPVCDVAPTSVGESFPPSPSPTTTRQDVPSTLPVSNTSRMALPPSLWQRSLAKLVLTTAATTLVVTGGLAYWLLGREPAVSTPVSTSRVPTSPVATPGADARRVGAPSAPSEPAAPTTGPNVRPLRSEPPEPPPAAPEPRVPPSAALDAVAPPAASPAADDAQRDALERRVRAARLERGRRARSNSTRSARSSTAAASGTGPVRSTSPSAAAPASVAAPSTPPRAAVTPRPSEPASNVVDGRRIRTSL